MCSEHECVICMEDGEDLIKLKCGHSFHNSCLEEWVFNMKHTCPCCRNSIIVPEDDNLLNRQITELQLVGNSIRSEECKNWVSYNIIGVSDDGITFEYDDGITRYTYFEDQPIDYTYMKWKCKNLEIQNNSKNIINS